MATEEKKKKKKKRTGKRNQGSGRVFKGRICWKKKRKKKKKKKIFKRQHNESLACDKNYKKVPTENGARALHATAP